MNFLLLILVILFILGGVPNLGPYGQYGWGAPSLGVVLLIVLLFFLFR